MKLDDVKRTRSPSKTARLRSFPAGIEVALRRTTTWGRPAVIYTRAIRFNRTEFALVLGIAFGLLILLSVASLFAQHHSAALATSQLVQLLSYELIVGTGVALILRHNGWRLPHFNLYPSLGATGAGVLLALVGAILLFACNWLVALAFGPSVGAPMHPHLALAAGSSSLLVATV